PPPQRLPRESTSLVPPGEIIAESKAALRRRLLRIVWAPGLVLLGPWYVLLWLYVSGASPTFWFLSLLAALGAARYLDTAILRLALLLVPLPAGRARRCELPRQRDPEPGLHPLRGGDGVHAGARRGDAAEPAHRPAGARARRRDAPAPLPRRAGLPARGVHTRHGHTHAPAGPDRAR